MCRVRRLRQLCVEAEEGGLTVLGALCQAVNLLLVLLQEGADLYRPLGGGAWRA